MNKRINFFVIRTGCLAALLLAAGCSQKKTPPPTLPVPVTTAQATTRDMPVRIDPPPVGHVTPTWSVNVRPQIGGIIQTVNFQEGQDVAKGDLLFTIDPRTAQAALTLAKGNLERDQAQLANARIQFERDRKLFEQKLVSQDAYDSSKAAVDALAGSVAADGAAVANAELNLQYTQIHAPISGRTGSLLVHEGNVVKANDNELVTINQIKPIYAAFSVAERFLPQIRQQMGRRTLTVSARYENMDGEPPQGELIFVDNAVDESTGTIKLKATFPNADARLWPGQFVQLGLQLDTLTNVVVVPSRAVQNSQDGLYVFVVKSDQTVEMREVKAGVSEKGFTTILSGLKAGETVVTDGQLRLTPGAKVSDQAREGGRRKPGEH